MEVLKLKDKGYKFVRVLDFDAWLLPPYKQKTISKVLRKKGLACSNCNRKGVTLCEVVDKGGAVMAAFYSEDWVRMTVDHIWPLVFGGANTMDNYQTLCQCCNVNKGAKLPGLSKPQGAKKADWREIAKKAPANLIQHIVYRYPELFPDYIIPEAPIPPIPKPKVVVKVKKKKNVAKTGKGVYVPNRDTLPGEVTKCWIPKLERGIVVELKAFKDIRSEKNSNLPDWECKAQKLTEALTNSFTIGSEIAYSVPITNTRFRVHKATVKSLEVPKGNPMRFIVNVEPNQNNSGEGGDLKRILIDNSPAIVSKAEAYISSNRMNLPEKLHGLKVKAEYPFNSIKEEPFSTHHRLKLFVNKSCTCVKCGVEGTRFISAMDKTGGLHYDVYTQNLVLMTNRFIWPKAHGGSDNLENLEPLCFECLKTTPSVIPAPDEPQGERLPHWEEISAKTSARLAKKKLTKNNENPGSSTDSGE